MEYWSEMGYYSYQVKGTSKIFTKCFGQRLHFCIFFFRRKLQEEK